MYLLVNGRVRVADDLAVGVVLHHDEENVVEMRDAAWNGAFLQKRSRPESADCTERRECPERECQSPTSHAILLHSAARKGREPARR